MNENHSPAELTAAVLQWWEGYVATYLERDLRQLSQIDSLPDFRRLMTALALRSGQILNQTNIAGDIGVSQPRSLAENPMFRNGKFLQDACSADRRPLMASSVAMVKRDP